MSEKSNRPAGGLELKDVTITLDGRGLIESLSVVVPPGRAFTIMGRSGAGKSSLLAYICGSLDHAFTASGKVEIDGREITGLPPEHRRVGILFQDDLLFPHMSVGENLTFALPRTVKGKAERRRRVDWALETAGLGGFYRRDPATLSGGQRARAAVMRALLSEPLALLLDEPFSKLDASTKKDFRGFVFRHAKERNLPTLLVTHDPEDARAASGPVIDLDANHRENREQL